MNYVFSVNPYPAVPTVESAIGRTPLNDNSIATNQKVYSAYEPSSQLKTPANKYAIAENIQNALRQQSAYAQVCNKTWLSINKFIHGLDSHSIIVFLSFKSGVFVKEWNVS